jgi:hypothetical protein
MAAFLKLISAILWLLNYVRQNPKKSAVGATGLAGVTTAAMFYGAPGVPTGGGVNPNNTPSDGDVVTWVDPTGAEWGAGGGGASDLVDLGDITNVETATDGHVLTANGDDTFTFEEVVGGSGDPIYTPDGTTEITRLPTYDPFNYGASGDLRVSRTSGSTSAGTSVALETGEGSMFLADQYIAIRGAGAEHDWQAVTPTAPTVGQCGTHRVTWVSGNILTLADYPSENFNSFGFASGYGISSNNDVSGTPAVDNDYIYLTVPPGVEDGHAVIFEGTLPGGLTAGTTYYMHFVGETTISSTLVQQWSLHTSRANARSDTSRVNITSEVSTGTYHIVVPLQFETSAANLPGASLLVATTYYARFSSGSPRRFTVHPTAADAAANTNVVTLGDAGSGNHWCRMVGDVTRSYRVTAHSGGGGSTVRSSATTTTTSLQSLKTRACDVIWWDAVDDGSGNLARWYTIHGGEDDRVLTRVSGTPNAKKLTFQAGGYTNFVPTDLGQEFIYTSNTRGWLRWYDNATRTAIVELDYDGGDTFPAGSVCTVGMRNPVGGAHINGVGGGTTTGDPVWCYCWSYGGDMDSDYDYRSMVWRSGKEIQIIQMSGTPTGATWAASLGSRKGFFTLSLAYNTTAAQFQTAIRTVPGYSGVRVYSVGSTPNFTYIIHFDATSGEYTLGDVPQIKVDGGALTGGTPVLWATTIVPGTKWNEGDVIVEPPTASGVLYEVRKATGERATGSVRPTFSTTRNATTFDSHYVHWVRADQLFTVSSPTAAVSDLYLGQIASKSTDTLTVTPATGSTVADDTPVWHDDGPAIQATHAAIESAGRGVIEFSGKSHNVFTRDVDADEWTLLRGAAGAVGWLEFDEATTQIDINGNGSEIWWRGTQLSAVSDDDGATEAPTNDDNPGMVLIDRCENDRLRISDISFIRAPSGEPATEASNSNNRSRLFGCATGGDEAEVAETVHLTRVRLIGIGMGTVISGSTLGSAGPYFNELYMRSGGSGHDALIGDGQIINSTIEGDWRRYVSTAVYTSDDNLTGTMLQNTHIINCAADGVRLRLPGSRIIRGSIVNYRDQSEGGKYTSLILAENDHPGRFVKGTLLAGGNILGIISVDHCTGYDVQCLMSGDDLKVTDNWFYLTENTRMSGNSGEAVIIPATGADNWIIARNHIRTSVLENQSADYGYWAPYGISLSTTGTGHQVYNNDVQTPSWPFRISSTFVGTAAVRNNKFINASFLNSSSKLTSLSPGNGAFIDYSGNQWGNAASSSAVTYEGTSSATHRCINETYYTEVEVASALTGTQNLWKECKFLDGTNSSDFLDAGTRIEDCEFAIAPTLTGATLFTRGNSVAGSARTSVALAANQDNYAWPITDTVIFTTTGTANYDITGVVARAPGSPIKAVNGDAADNVTIKHDVTSTDANRFNVNAGTDIVLGPDDAASFIGTGGVNTGWSQD